MRKLVLLGLAMILIGTSLALIGPWKQIARVPATFDQELTICDKDTFNVDSGDYAVFSAQLGSNSNASGYFKVYSGSIRFFVVDDENFQEWRDGNSSAVLLFSYDDTRTGRFELQIERAGMYHFVFDNTNRDNEKKIYFTASAKWTESGTMDTVVDNPTPVYIGIATAFCGIAIVIVGLRTRGKKSRYEEIRELWLGKEPQ